MEFLSSSHRNLWPIYLSVTSLPPHLRMNSDYLLLAGIWSGPVKPDMNVLLQPILTSIKILYSQGIAVKTPVGTRTIKAKVLMAVLDLPAKATATNMVQFNGKYGCNYCTDKGETVNSRRVYPATAAHTTRTMSRQRIGQQVQSVVKHLSKVLKAFQY